MGGERPGLGGEVGADDVADVDEIADLLAVAVDDRRAPGPVTVNGEQRSLRATGDSFSDSFGPHQAHVYVITNGGH